VGGIVGVKKYIDDFFGDTINTTSRMESNSEPMRINVSETTYQILKDKFKFTQREPMEIKGKGKMQMYFLEG
jgi:class 3 adenylate cyclase